ncbi:ankyrin repeat domain-containing protein [bacterium]|nr:ankyrin repeat domain-containing protein [bacterium]
MKSQLITIAAVMAVVLTAFAGPIHDAVIFGDLAGVQAELDKGADVNAKDITWDGWTPLHWAVMSQGREIAELLIAKGANIEAKDDGGESPLHLASYHGIKETAEVLIAHGADLEGKNNNGSTPLIYATGRVQTELVKMLISKGADVNAENKYGMTALHYAAILSIGTEASHKEIAELLIVGGADVNSKSIDGETPLDLAIKHTKRSTATLLRKYDAKTGEELALIPRLTFIRSPLGFTFNTIVGKTYRVDSGTDLKKWNNLKDIKGTGNEVKFIDMRRIYFPRHFYRVVVVD